MLFLLSVFGSAQAGEFPVADKVLIEKSKRVLHLLKDGEPFRTFRIALGIRPIGDKEHEGDFKTPEGNYRLDVFVATTDADGRLHTTGPGLGLMTAADFR